MQTVNFRRDRTERGLQVGTEPDPEITFGVFSLEHDFPSAEVNGDPDKSRPCDGDQQIGDEYPQSELALNVG